MSFFTQIKKLTTASAAIAMLATGAVAIAGHHVNKSHSKMSAESSLPTIVGVAAGNENFKTLVAAVKAADLVETLNSKGPFTVFAPTERAFSKLPKGTVSTLVKPENKKLLTQILTYHVVAGDFRANEVMALLSKNGGSISVPTVQGGKLTISKNHHGGLTLIDAKGNMSNIVATDVAASNGVIHVIDSVVMPK